MTTESPKHLSGLQRICKLYGRMKCGWAGAGSRFWSKVAVGEPHECWMWKASVSHKGYGQFQNQGSVYRSHRVVWEMVNGKIVDKLCILHKCDVPACCNPDHLFLGTHQDNTNDKMNKKRHRFGRSLGERHGMSKLTNEKVVNIRTAWSAGVSSQRQLSAQFGVSLHVVSQIINRRAWTHI